jgi:predicted membrane protein
LGPRIAGWERSSDRKEVRLILLWLRLVFILQVMIEWAFALAFALPRTRIQLKKTQQEKQRNKTRKGTTKQERGKQTRSKDKKKEVWESKWAILISLEVKIYACQSTCPI